MAQTICVILNPAERERLAAIVADRTTGQNFPAIETGIHIRSST
jgi:hypothetical protein